MRDRARRAATKGIPAASALPICIQQPCVPSGAGKSSLKVVQDEAALDHFPDELSFTSGPRLSRQIKERIDVEQLEDIGCGLIRDSDRILEFSTASCEPKRPLVPGNSINRFLESPSRKYSMPLNRTGRS